MVGRDHGDRRLRRGRPRLRQREVLLGEHAVESGDDLTGFDHHAFFDQHLDDLAGDLGGDGRLAARHHVARCGETARPARFRGRGRRRWSGWRRRCCGGLLLHRRLDADNAAQIRCVERDRRQGSEHEAAAAEQRRPALPPCRGCRLAAAAVDRQGAQQFGLVVGHRVSPDLPSGPRAGVSASFWPVLPMN
jgi:hypothetical protein